jgi:hypothetical protein
MAVASSDSFASPGKSLAALSAARLWASESFVGIPPLRNASRNGSGCCATSTLGTEAAAASAGGSAGIAVVGTSILAAEFATEAVGRLLSCGEVPSSE